jgi:hypothetical protein
VGLVIFLSGQIVLWIFCYSIGRRKKITKVYSYERISAEIKSLSILCVGGIGKPMLTGGMVGWGGGVWSRKIRQQKIGGPFAICSFYTIAYIKKCGKYNDRKKIRQTNFSQRDKEKVYTVTASVYPKM